MRSLLLTAIGCLLVTATGASLPGGPNGLSFEKIEVPVYHFEDLTPQVALVMDYAKAEIHNPGEWNKVKYNSEIESIELVFTKYPADLNKWAVGYNQLLEHRLKALFAIDPTLNNPRLKWKMVLQTKCTTEAAAKNYFHGFVIKYKVKHPRVVRFINNAWDIESVVAGQTIPQDTSLLRVLDRNAHWKDALVVMDWTGSMYQYGAQMLLWQKRHLDAGMIRHFVFFNDGNRKTTSQKQIGKTGGIYHAPALDLMEVIETMSLVMENGWGGDAPENDLEAVLKGTTLLTGYREVILVADNASGVRDLPLISSIHSPVHIILCDIADGAVMRDYVEIAFRTGGSIHTRTQDINGFDQLKEGDVIAVNKNKFRVEKGKLVPTV